MLGIETEFLHATQVPTALSNEPLNESLMPDRLCMSLCHHSSQKWEDKLKKRGGKETDLSKGT